jgi:hypothetical protein
LVQTDEERKAKKRERNKKYRESQEGKKKIDEYNSRPEVKARVKEYNSRPENDVRRKLREQSSKYKARAKAYNARPEVKAKRKTYQQTSEYKEMKKEYTKAYYEKSENKERRRLVERKRKTRPEVKAHRKKYQQIPENMAKVKKTREDKRLKILQHYSLSLSNSNIPCCNCCGENFHTDFLAIDHVLGRKEMESIPELVSIGYSSKLEGENLMRWIMKNNFPEGFKILCHNCNMAKGMKKNNYTCPHETARKEETFARMEEQSSFEAGF